MLRRTRRASWSVFETPVFEQIPLLRLFTSSDTSGTQFARGLPRNVNGFIEGCQPRYGGSIKWYPYRQEVTVNDTPVPTISDTLNQHYFPPSKNDDEKLLYVQEKTGRPLEELAQELFQMRRVKLIGAQSLRDKVRGSWFRAPVVNYNKLEKKYMDETLKIAQLFSMDFFCNGSYDPTLVHSPHYELCEPVDAIFHKQLRERYIYMLIDVVVHKSIPSSRMPCHQGLKCQEPIADIEPCLMEHYKLKLSAAANIIIEEKYVADQPWDTNHKYHACLIHIRPCHVEPQFLVHDVIPLELDLPRGREWLDHHYKARVASKGISKLERGL
jgi:hypothetical protein